jgi:branched-chain amino acid aminotransferase
MANAFFMTSFIHFNGNIFPAEQALTGAGNRGLRYGDGLFETMRVVNGRIALPDLHVERLLGGMAVLQFDLPAFFTAAHLSEAILVLCKKMKIEAGARVRLNVFRGNGGLYDPENHHPNIVIEAWPLELPTRLHENGLVIDIYTEARKHPDILANLKTNNYLPYILAALYAKNNRLNDCLLLNSAGRICDATIANVFWVKDGKLFTPPLSEGGVAGVMRKYLLDQVKGDYAVQEALLTPETLALADEVFLTNAIQGIRWVREWKNKVYTNVVANEIFQQYVKPLWGSL